MGSRQGAAIRTLLAAMAVGAMGIEASAEGTRSGAASLEMGTAKRLQLEVKGGKGILSFAFGRIDVEVRPHDGADFQLLIDDRRKGLGIPAPLAALRREGDAAVASVDLGDIRLFRLEGGDLLLKLRVPASYGGSIELAVPEGSIRASDLRLAGLRASVGIGSLELKGVFASEMLLKTREASSRLVACGSASGRIETGLGAVRADGLDGSWSIAGKEGSITLSLDEGFGNLDIKTTLGAVRLDLPDSEPFSLEASSCLRMPKSDLELAWTIVSRFPRERCRYTGRFGAGGPRVSVATDEGAIAVTRSPR